MLYWSRHVKPIAGYVTLITSLLSSPGKQRGSGAGCQYESHVHRNYMQPSLRLQSRILVFLIPISGCIRSGTAAMHNTPRPVKTLFMAIDGSPPRHYFIHRQFI